MTPAAKPVIKKRLPWGWIALGILGVLAVGVSFAQRLAPLNLALAAPAVYKAGERNPLVTASGYLVARHRATLSAKVPGRVVWLGVEEGSRVTRGQVLARLEDSDLRAARDQTAANLAQAELDLHRGEALAKDGILDRASLDRLRSAVTALKAQLRYQDASLENMVLRAPFTGTVTQKLSEVGETVSPGTAGGANAINAVAVLADFDSLEVEVEVTETGITKLRKGMPVEIRVDALENDPRAQVLKGELREIYPTSNRQKAVVIVRVAFLQKDDRLLPDMGTKVTFLGDPYPKDVVVLGREQVVRRRDQTLVWVLRDGRAVLQVVKVVAENPVGLEIEGLDPATRLLVIPADLKLQEGARVKVRG
ncbi:efflux RND transporter periplasmic adaptor subunit [Holophaga foetida]|uniref:efflux RND transporter periplasmic adaptor subunit n=1 Tax=Holophaga foetida TaxID=35839 RepID=UPI00024720F7|nr:efflux RND transporter periplasmic adaptor subunit [Holophaga foetida]